MIEVLFLPPYRKQLVVSMTSLYPRSTSDTAFAPVLIGIERNLEWLRGCDDLELALALDLNDDDGWYHGPDERAERVRRSAVATVPLHGLEVIPTDDGHGRRIRLSRRSTGRPERSGGRQGKSRTFD